MLLAIPVAEAVVVPKPSFWKARPLVSVDGTPPIHADAHVPPELSSVAAVSLEVVQVESGMVPPQSRLTTNVPVLGPLGWCMDVVEVVHWDGKLEAVQALSTPTAH